MSSGVHRCISKEVPIINFTALAPLEQSVRVKMRLSESLSYGARTLHNSDKHFDPIFFNKHFPLT